MKYRIRKRTTIGPGWNAYPGDIVEDPPNAEILLAREYLEPVGDNTPLSQPASQVGVLIAVSNDKPEEVPYTELQAKAKALGIPSNQSRKKLEAAIAEAEKAAVAPDAKAELEAMTEEELVEAAHKVNVNPTSRDETIAAILEAQGYKEPT